MPGHPADGGDRGAAVGDAEVGQQLAGGEHGVEVHRRLPHAHEDDVVDRLDAAEVQRLVEDLVGAEVAAELHLAGGAEGAGQRAARLRGEADRAAAVAVAHQHRLERAPVGGVEERLDGAVVGLRLGLEAERRERHRGREPLAQRRRQVGHLLVGARRRARPTPRPGRRGRRARRPRRGCCASSSRSIAASVGAGSGFDLVQRPSLPCKRVFTRERLGRLRGPPCSRRRWSPARPGRRPRRARERAITRLPAGKVLHRRYGEIHTSRCRR